MRHTPRIGIEARESRELLTTLVPEIEINDHPRQATVATFDPIDGLATLTGRIACFCDTDYYEFNSPVDGTVAIVPDPAVGGPDLKVMARGPSGAILNRAGAGGPLVFNVRLGERVLVQVRADQRLPGNYQVEMVVDPNAIPPTPPPPPDVYMETEPNNVPAQANPIALGPDGAATIFGSIPTPNDRDFYSLTADATGKINLSLTASFGCRPAVTVRDASGRPLFFGRAGNNDSIAGGFRVRAGQRLRVEVSTQGRGIGDSDQLHFRLRYGCHPRTGEVFGLNQNSRSMCLENALRHRIVGQLSGGGHLL